MVGPIECRSVKKKIIIPVSQLVEADENEKLPSPNSSINQSDFWLIQTIFNETVQ